jgi:hypothetical protein
VISSGVSSHGEKEQIWYDTGMMASPRKILLAAANKEEGEDPVTASEEAATGSSRYKMEKHEAISLAIEKRFGQDIAFLH